jgi:hypothetical protein
LTRTDAADLAHLMHRDDRIRAKEPAMQVASNVKAGLTVWGGRNARSTIGCFVAGTRVRMATGDELPVEQLERVSPTLCRPDGSTVRLTKIMIGNELSPIYHITLESGIELGVTEAHPMVVRHDGLLHVVAAETLLVGDEVPTVTEGFATELARVACVEVRRYTGLVYNFYLQRGRGPDQHLVIANGIVTGDNTLQEISAHARACVARGSVPATSPPPTLLFARLEEKYRATPHGHAARRSA